jgi:hypothetical protein
MPDVIKIDLPLCFSKRPIPVISVSFRACVALLDLFAYSLSFKGFHEVKTTDVCPMYR